MRAGGQTLTLLAAARIFRILRSLADGRKGQRQLRRDAGSPAQSTLRGHLSALAKAGAIHRKRFESFPSALECELTEAGRELCVVAEATQRWLAQAPDDPVELGTDPARAAVKGLVEGWSATVLAQLSVGPLSLTELDKRISTVSYPSIERCLETMRLAEQIEAGTRSSKGTPYSLTDWLRRGLTPLTFAARWEDKYRPMGADPITRADIDDAILVGGPLFKLSGEVSGVCRLAVSIPNGKQRDNAFAYLELGDDGMSFAGVKPRAKPDARASGTAASWFATVIDADTADLRLSGDTELVAEFIDCVREALFSDAVQQ